MRRRGLPITIAWVAAGLAGVACGPSRPPERTGFVEVVPPPLPPLAAADPAAPGAAYLTTVARSIQPHWGQFLEDCRLRLPPSHPLNDRSLVATAELAIERDGTAHVIRIATSGSADFDLAVREVLAEAERVAPPPVELWSDDDRTHLTWTFARDRRQAGPATARVVLLDLPLGGVIDRQLAAGDLARAARRIARAPVADPMRAPAAERVMLAALAEALAAPTGARALAVEAIGRVRAVALAPELRGLVGPTTDAELRIAAIGALAALDDRSVVPALASALPGDLARAPRLALAEVAALVALGGRARVAAILRRAVGQEASVLTALHAHALAPDPAIAGKLAARFARRDARMRVAVCAAIPAEWPPHPLVLRGLRDPDATVRAACADAAGRQGQRVADAAVVGRLRELAADRDQVVRARAVSALAQLDPNRVARAAGDPSSEVRIAAVARATEGELRVLVADPEPAVRAAALAMLGDRAAELVVRAAADPAPEVRRVAAGVLADEAALERLVSDGSPDVATAALVQLVQRRGRGVMTGPLLEQLAAAPAASPERVRIAQAWLAAPR